MQIKLGLTAAATGTADAITATFSPAPTALVDRMVLFVTASAANATTTPTFSPNGLTPHTITKFGGNALQSGDILGAGHVLLLQYNSAGTRWELLNPAKLLTYPTLAQVLSSDNKTDEQFILSNNGASTLHIHDDEFGWSFTHSIGFNSLFANALEFTQNRSSGDFFNSLQFTDDWSFISYTDGTKTGSVKLETAQAEVYHDDLIQLTAPSVQKNGYEIATQNYVGQLLQSNIKIIGDWDASSGSYPLADESNTTPFIAQWGATIKAGWAFRVGYGQAGTVDGFDYENGDVVYALVDNPTDDSEDWGDLDHNLQQASESLRGTAKIATTAIVEDETTLDNEKIVTPNKFWAKAIPRFLALAWTWTLKQTFTAAPKFSSTTANQRLEVDSNKELISVAKGTADNKNFGTAAGTVCEGNDVRLNDTRNGKLLFKLNTTLSHTGTTTPTVIASFPIPIGFNEANDFWHIWGMCGVDITGGGGGNNQIRLYIGPNPTDIGGATYTASIFVASTLRTYPIARTFVFKNSLTTFEGSALTTDGVQTDYASFSNAPASVTIDFSTQKYLHVLGILANAGNIIYLRSLMSKIDR